MPGTPGRLSPDRFGFSMPVTDPPFDRPPYYYRGIEVMGFAYETDDDAAAAIVPEGLTIAHSPAIAQLIFTNFHFSTLGAYTEAILGVSCLWEGEPVTYCANLLVTNEVGLIGGREPYGFPKLFGEVEWVKEHEIISAYAERPKGKRICTGVLRPRDILAPEDVASPPLVTLKVELIVGSDGRGEGFSGPGNVTFDSPSAVDPWHRMPVRRMVAASWGRYNFVLPYGRVIKRYEVAGAAEPVEPPAIVAGA
jgi:acetoacetate decarboxylase